MQTPSIEAISTPELTLLMVAASVERNPTLFRNSYLELSRQIDVAEFKRFLSFTELALSRDTYTWSYEQFALMYAGAIDG